jgi:hypothetical protein
MKQISLRRFRDSIGDLREPVAVSRRDPEGSYVILGEWHPSITNGRDAVILPALEPGFNSMPFTPVPKRGK